MNAHPITAIVTSSDGVEFAVATQAAAIVYEETFAAARTAAELEAHGDFVRLADMGTQEQLDAELNAEIGQISRVTAVSGDDVEALDRARKRWGAAGFVWGDV